MPSPVGATLPTSAFLVAWALAAIASIAVFLHANKHGSRHATAWGAGVFLLLAVVLPAYVVHYRLTSKRQRRY